VYEVLTGKHHYEAMMHGEVGLVGTWRHVLTGLLQWGLAVLHWLPLMGLQLVSAQAMRMSHKQ
jgi:hypothetical protein